MPTTEDTQISPDSLPEATEAPRSNEELARLRASVIELESAVVIELASSLRALALTFHTAGHKIKRFALAIDRLATRDGEDSRG